MTVTHEPVSARSPLCDAVLSKQGAAANGRPSMRPQFLAGLFAILFCVSPSVTVLAQPVQSQPAGYPDIAIYYSQLKGNTFEERMARRRYLCETIPVDTILAAYPLKGLTEHGETISTLDYFDYLPLTTQERLAFAEQLYAKVRSRYKSKQMELLADFVKWIYMGDDSPLSYELKMKQCEQMIRKARKAGDSSMEAVVLRVIWTNSFYGQRYARAFAYGQRLEETLERVDDSYRYKAYDYLNMGMAYYMFKNYDRAMPFFHKALSHSKTSVEHNPDVAPKAWNYLAVYHEINNNLDSAAYYHRTILSSEEARRSPPAHLAIAISNLGRIEMENGNYDAAIAMLKAGLDYEKADLDISFKSGIRISLGRCYLEKGEMKAAWEQIANARSMVDNQPEFGRQQRLKDLYTLESSYYARSGEYNLAQLYQDSALMASSQYEQLTGQHFIVLGEQQLQEAELQLKSQQIAQQRNVIFTVLVILAVVCGTLFVILQLYRKRNAAYKVLARKAEEWARQSEVSPASMTPGRIAADKPEPPTKEDRRIMAMADRTMAENHAYRDPGLTVESLADRLDVHRNALSRAVNRMTGGNFNNYINGHRIKEAVRIISETSRKEVYIEELSERVGFGNRNTFSRTFKQFTGLSPLGFQKQKGNNLKPGEF